MWPAFAQLMAECRQAHWRHLANTTELVLPWAHPSLHSTTQTANWLVQPFLHRLQQNVSILYNGHRFRPKLRLPMGGSGFPSNLWFLGPISAHIPKGISNGSAIFAQLTAQCPYSLQWAPLSPKNCAFARGASIQLMIPCASPSPQSKKTASWLVEPFLHRWPQSVPVFLYFTMGCPFPLKIAPPVGMWFFGSTQVLKPKWYLDRFLQGSLLWQTHWQTMLLGR